MSEPFIAEIRVFGFNFAPRNWAFCQGQIVSIVQNTALFSLLGTTYGGNGQTTFGLPNLQGMAGIGQGNGPGLTPQSLGQVGGVNSVTLVASEIPQHTHTLSAGVLSTPNAAQNVATPANNAMFGLAGPNNTYIDPVTPNTAFNAAAIANTGSSTPHENRQPFLALNFCICMAGIFPARN